MPGEQSSQTTARSGEATPLYRIENPNIQAHPDGVTSHEDLVGQWFTPNLTTAISYLRKSTQTFGKDSHPVDGTQLVVAHVPIDELDSMHVSQHPIASHMDVENDNYIIPRDGSVHIQELPLDEVLSDLKGELGNFMKLEEARRRIVMLAGQIAVEAS